MKPNIVFDMGQVLMDFAPPKFIARLGYTGDDAQALLQEIFRGWEWVAFDRGEVTGQGVVDSACSRLPQRLHQAARDLVFHWWDEMIPMPGAKELVTELHEKGYPLYVLSNASQDFHIRNTTILLDNKTHENASAYAFFLSFLGILHILCDKFHHGFCTTWKFGHLLNNIEDAVFFSLC